LTGLPRLAVRSKSLKGSWTTGVDGASEGGRIDSYQLDSALALYGVALASVLKDRGVPAAVVTPVASGGGVYFDVTVALGAELVPDTWYGRRVVVRDHEVRLP
jgi:hypothetical protein